MHEDQFLSLICLFLCSIHPLNISHIGYLFPWGTSFLTIILSKKLYSHAKLSWKNGQKCPGNPGNVLEFQLGKRVATLTYQMRNFQIFLIGPSISGYIQQTLFTTIGEIFRNDTCAEDSSPNYKQIELQDFFVKFFFCQSS